MPENTDRVVSKLPWAAFLPLVSWYCLAGWVIDTAISPSFYWILAFAISFLLIVALNYSLLMTVVGVLVLSCVSVNLVVDVMILLGNDTWQAIANEISFDINDWKSLLLFIAVTLLISACWFSPLFWAKRELTQREWRKIHVLLSLTLSGWIGLGLGTLIT